MDSTILCYVLRTTFVCYVFSCRPFELSSFFSLFLHCPHRFFCSPSRHFLDVQGIERKARKVHEEGRTAVTCAVLYLAGSNLRAPHRLLVAFFFQSSNPTLQVSLELQAVCTCDLLLLLLLPFHHVVTAFAFTFTLASSKDQRWQLTLSRPQGLLFRLLQILPETGQRSTFQCLQ